MEMKLVKDSYTVMTELVLQSHVNGTGRLFGGQLMAWMDIAGAICAKRHANYEVVTAAAHQLSFFRPALPNDLVVIKAKMLGVGNSSMRVGITVEIESYSGRRVKMEKTCSAEFVYVAIDPKGQKRTVPRLAFTEEDSRL